MAGLHVCLIRAGGRERKTSRELLFFAGGDVREQGLHGIVIHGVHEIKLIIQPVADGLRCRIGDDHPVFDDARQMVSGRILVDDFFVDERSLPRRWSFLYIQAGPHFR